MQDHPAKKSQALRSASARPRGGAVRKVGSWENAVWRAETLRQAHKAIAGSERTIEDLVHNIARDHSRRLAMQHSAVRVPRMQPR